VEHACHKCGASVEDGTPFCPQCNAPQIRVGVIETGVAAGGASEITIPSSAVHAGTAAVAIEWMQGWRSALIAVAVAVCLTMLGTPVGLGLLVAGFLSVLLYQRRSGAVQLSAGLGAKLGALTGLLGFGLALIVALVGLKRSGQQVQQTVLETIQEYAAHDPRLPQVVDLFKTPEGFAITMVLGLGMLLVAFLLFSSLGGALGAVLLRRKDRV
jgi:zinc-ribbon domain